MEDIIQQTLDPITIIQIPHSTSALIYKIELEDQNPVLVRAFPHHPNLADYEFNVLHKLHEAHIPVPKPLQVHKFKKGSFLVMEFINGPLLGETLQANPSLMEEYVGNLVRIHSLDWTHLFPKGKPSSLKKIAKNTSKEAKRHGFNELAGWIKKEAKSVQEHEPVLNHGDYHPNNIIVENNALRIIDWEGIDISDHRFDLAFAALTASIFTGPATEKQIAHHYHASTQKTIEDLDFFIVLEAIPRITKLSQLLTPEFAEYETYSIVLRYLKQRVEQITDAPL